MASVALENLTFSYFFAERPALSDVSFSVRSGEFVVLGGADGAGKSSVCYAASGLIPHFYKGTMTGEVLIDGIPVKNLELEDLLPRIGIVFQNPFNQFSHTKSTVYEELACTMENLGFPPEVMRERVEDVLEQTNIAHLRDRHPNTLSGGQAQRVALASVLVIQPEILILDEPVSQLDPYSSKAILKLLKTINNSGITIIITTHDLLEGIIECADRIIVLDNGRVVHDNTPRSTIAWLLAHNPRFLIPLYTKVARRADAMGLRHGEKVAITLDEAATGFMK